MALHTTAITPATSVLKIRIIGDSGSGRVSTLPRGTIVGTYAGFPRNFDRRYHEPLLIGIPDGWTVTQETADYFNANTRAGARRPVPFVLAEEATVRRENGHVWADAHVSVVISGCSELIAKFLKDDIPRGQNVKANNVFYAGSQIYVWRGRIGALALGVKEFPLCRSDAERIALVGARMGGAQNGNIYPLGTFVFPPNSLPTESKQLFSNVYISSLMGMQIGDGNYSHGDARP